MDSYMIVNGESCLSLHYVPDMNRNTSLEKVMVDMINIIEISNSRVRRINLIYIFCIPYTCKQSLSTEG